MDDANPLGAENAPLVGVVGLGRLGGAVIEACAQQRLTVVLQACRSGWRVDKIPDVIVDASAAGAYERVRSYCEQNRVALVECVSDLNRQQSMDLVALARQVPVVRAINLAFGHYLQAHLVRYLASLHGRPPRPPGAFTSGAVSVWERHPVTKAHRPSATATQLAGGWEDLTGIPVADVASLRAGPPVSEHEVILSLPGETLSVRHSVSSYTAAGAGAVLACRWVHSRPAGLQNMQVVYDDVLRATS